MSSKARVKALADVIGRLGAATGPQEAARFWLSGFLKALSAESGSLYFFDLPTGTFASYASEGSSVLPARLNLGSKLGEAPHPLERLVAASCPGLVEDANAKTWVALPISRNGAPCVGLVVAGVDGVEDQLETIASRMRYMLDLALLVYDWRFRRRLIESVQEPLDYDTSEADFYQHQVMTLVSLASQMEFAALREYASDTDALITLGQYGFTTLENLRDLDLFEISDLPAFKDVVKTRESISVADFSGSEFVALRNMPLLERVQSFVACPVLVGSELFGVLSFASSVPYHYTYDEIQGLQTLANGIGVSIANYRNLHKANARVASFQAAATAITAVEVAQAVRHEARAYADDALTSLTILGRLFASQTPKQQSIIAGVEADRGEPKSDSQSRSNSAVSAFREELDDIGVALHNLNLALDKIKTATKAPARDRELVSLRDVWQQARTAVSGKLASVGVRNVDYQGPDVKVFVAPDWFRQVFLNLLLNSAEAFREGSSNKRNRNITLYVDSGPERSNTVNLRYVDNAGGIQFSQLRNVASTSGATSPEQQIFEAGVTSKEDGSGWGLLIVRSIVKQYGGSVDLVGTRGGVTFDIKLPKDATRKESGNA